MQYFILVNQNKNIIDRRHIYDSFLLAKNMITNLFTVPEQQEWEVMRLSIDNIITENLMREVLMDNKEN
jgi:hypothetical protein